MENLTIVIPARLNSQRLPNKALLDLAGKPMILRVVERVKRALPICDLCVATDSLLIAKAVEMECRVEMTSENCKNGTERLIEIANRSKYNPSHRFINVQGDEPLISIELLQNFAHFTLEQVEEMGSVCAYFSSQEEFENPNRIKLVLDHFGRALYFSRSPIPYGPPGTWKQARKHIGIYSYTVKTLGKLGRLGQSQLEKSESLEQLRALQAGIQIKMMSFEGRVEPGIDTLEDYEFVRKVLQSDKIRLG